MALSTEWVALKIGQSGSGGVEYSILKMKSKSNYEKRLEYNNTYNRNNYRSFSMRLHNENEADLIEWIESQDSVKEYLLSLVRKDIEKSKKKEKKKKTSKK